MVGCGGSAASSAARTSDDGSAGVDAGAVAGGDAGFEVAAATPPSTDATSPADATDATTPADAISAADGADAASASECGTSDCAGCCSGGQCVSGTAQTACGHHGGPCVDCTSLGATCTSDGGVGGACQLAATCGPNTCPMGCCDANGVCQGGTLPTACGGGGASCQTCGLHQPCEQQQCGAACSALTCPSGCCDSAGICEPGTGGRGMCGAGRRGGGCPGPGCVSEPDGGSCNAQTCPSGCCDAADNCQPGVTGTACGTSGASCENCLFNDQLCSDQQCLSPLDDGGPSCSVDTCPGGCCDALGACVVLATDQACGEYGSACIDCTQAGAHCNVGQCELPDGAVICEQSCSGCCDGNGACQAGLTDTQCGENGSPCVNCATLNPPSTCNVYDYTCTSQQTQCPAAYPTCPAALEESAPAPSDACSTDEIDNAAAACAGGATTPACSAFFAFESSSNAACGRCLATFDFDFAAESGIRACVAPYVDATCNQNSACLVDCITDACFHCGGDPSLTAQCQTQARSGTCSTYIQADGCVTQALAGAAAICNPATYQGDLGAWLMAVAAAYCAQP
jgi:hypothetical protein